MMKSEFCWTIGLLLWLCAPCILHAQSPYPPVETQTFEAVPAPPSTVENAEPVESVLTEYTDDGSRYEVTASSGEYESSSGLPMPSANRGRSRLATWWIERAKPCLQYSHWGYPEYFEEAPAGARVRYVQNAQICNGWAARLMLYHYDFCEGTSELNLHGQRRLQELASDFPIWMHHALTIESTPGDSQLDRERRDYIAALLANAGTPARVEVGYSKAVSPFGDETKVVGDNFLRDVRSSPITSAIGGGMSGGMSGGSGSVSGR